MKSNKVLVILDNDLINDGRVIKELKIFDKFNIIYHVLCYDFGKAYSSDEKITRIKYGQTLKKKLQPLINTIPIISWIWALKIKKVIKKFNPDFIHIHDLYMMQPVKRAMMSLKKRPPLVLDLHENYPAAIFTYPFTTAGINKYLIRPAQWEIKEKSLLSAADTLIVLDETFGKSLKTKYTELDNKQIIEFPNYIDLDELGKNNKGDVVVELSGKIMLYFGMVGKRRGIDDALDAFQEVLKKNLDLSFLIIGPVDKDFKNSFENLIKNRDIKDRIQHIPWMSLDKLNYYMSIADFAIAPFQVSPQTESGIANKIFQYLYGKLPIIVSNARPMANLVTKFKCGLVYRNHEELQQAIVKMTLEDKLRKEMASNSNVVIHQEFAAEKFEKRLVSIYS